MRIFKLSRFLHRVEEGYRTNPYHSRTHAADVLRTLHVLLHRGGLVPGYADPTYLLASYLAAIIHDFEHVGLSNDFLVNTCDPLALRYNDKAPMENHHLAAAFSLMAHPEYNFLASIPKAEFSRLRKVWGADCMHGLIICWHSLQYIYLTDDTSLPCSHLLLHLPRCTAVVLCPPTLLPLQYLQLVIELVLATEMKSHFAIIGHFSTVHGLGSSTIAMPLRSRSGSSGSSAAEGDQQVRGAVSVTSLCSDRGCFYCPPSPLESLIISSHRGSSNRSSSPWTRVSVCCRCSWRSSARTWATQQPTCPCTCDGFRGWRRRYARARPVSQ